MMFKRLFGKEEEDDGGISINMANVTLPLDLALEMIIRQQNQLFGSLNNVIARIEVGEHVDTQIGETMTHLHDDVVQLRQVLEGAAKHPVEKVDDVTEEHEHKKDERPN